MHPRAVLPVLGVALLGACNHGTFIHVSVAGASSLSMTKLHVTIDNAHQMTTVDFDRGGGAFALPQSFVLDLDADRRGDALITVHAMNGASEVGTASGSVQIAAGGTAELGLMIGLEPVDMEHVACKSPTPDWCGDSCVDLQSDVHHCKSCDTVCSYAHAGATCVQGSCVLGGCQQGYMHCTGNPLDGCETDVMGKDTRNCGGCNIACKLGQVCVAGSCKDNGLTCASPGITCRQPGCYDTGRYLVSEGGGIVVDLKNNRRLWTRATRGPNTHLDAQSDCTTTAVEGINGWRLPTYVELSATLYMAQGLQSCPGCDPAIDQAAFNDTPDSATAYYLTNDPYNGGGWETVYFCDGRRKYPTQDPSLYRCTRDPLP